EKEYGKCREEPLKDEMGRDIVIPKLFTQRWEALGTTPHHLSQSEASMISLEFVDIDAGGLHSTTLTGKGEILKRGWRRGEHGRLELGDNDQISKIVPQKLNHIPDQDIIQFVKP
ncbi:hypothetical protein HID58_067063, partial [Brassica napus]